MADVAPPADPPGGGAPPVALSHFMGTHTPKLDEKGRIFLPAKFRPRLADGVVVTQGQENCLVVWPADVHAREATRLLDRAQSRKSARAISRVFFSGADEGTLDKQGRIGIPGHLRGYAGLERDAVVIGVGDRIEIWEPTRWAAYSEPAIADYADLDEDDDD